MGAGEDRARVVLLGASNLTLAFPHVVASLRARLAGPLEVLAAVGHGRSYGNPSSVLFRELPGIARCGLWDALDRGGPRRTFALAADLGNDIAYGAGVDEISGWVEHALARLADAGARTVLVRLPVAVVETLPPLRFGVARTVIFPGRRLELEQVRASVRELDARMTALARSLGVVLAEQQASWYGLDPIHIRRSRRAEAWETILATLGLPTPGPGTGALSSSERRALRRARPERRRLLGRPLERAQPSVRLPDGTTIALY